MEDINARPGKDSTRKDRPIRRLLRGDDRVGRSCPIARYRPTLLGIWRNMRNILHHSFRGVLSHKVWRKRAAGTPALAIPPTGPLS